MKWTVLFTVTLLLGCSDKQKVIDKIEENKHEISRIENLRSELKLQAFYEGRARGEKEAKLGRLLPDTLNATIKDIDYSVSILMLRKENDSLMLVLQK